MFMFRCWGVVHMQVYVCFSLRGSSWQGHAVYMCLGCVEAGQLLGGSSCMVKMRPKLPLHGTAKK